MLGWLLAVATLAEAPRTIDQRRPEPVWVTVSRSDNFAAAPSASVVYASVSDLLQARHLRPRLLDTVDVDACMEQHRGVALLACQVATAAGIAEAPFFLQVFATGTGANSEVRIAVLDLEIEGPKVREALEQAGRRIDPAERQADLDALSLRLLDRLRYADPKSATTPDDLGAVIEDQLNHLRVEHSDQVVLELTTNVPATEVRLGAEPLGEVGEGLRVRGGLPKQLDLTATAPGHWDQQHKLNLAPNSTHQLHLEMAENHSLAWWLLTGTGIAMLGTGIGLAVEGFRWNDHLDLERYSSVGDREGQLGAPLRAQAIAAVTLMSAGTVAASVSFHRHRSDHTPAWEFAAVALCSATSAALAFLFVPKD